MKVSVERIEKSNKEQVIIKGTKHLNLTDLPLSSPILANMLQGGKAKINKYDCIETMNHVILEFFDCYLKDGGSFNSAGTDLMLFLYSAFPPTVYDRHNNQSKEHTQCTAAHKRNCHTGK